jgi:hypothetical protein
MGYLLTSKTTGKTMLIKHSELAAAYQWAGLGYPGHGNVPEHDALRLAEAVRRKLPELETVTADMIGEVDLAEAEALQGEDPDKPPSYLIHEVPPRTQEDPHIMPEFMELAEAGPFEVSEIPEA